MSFGLKGSTERQDNNKGTGEGVRGIRNRIHTSAIKRVVHCCREERSPYSMTGLKKARLKFVGDHQDED